MHNVSFITLIFLFLFVDGTVNGLVDNGVERCRGGMEVAERYGEMH